MSHEFFFPSILLLRIHLMSSEQRRKISITTMTYYKRIKSNEHESKIIHYYIRCDLIKNNRQYEYKQSLRETQNIIITDWDNVTDKIVEACIVVPRFSLVLSRCCANGLHNSLYRSGMNGQNGIVRIERKMNVGCQRNGWFDAKSARECV